MVSFNLYPLTAMLVFASPDDAVQGVQVKTLLLLAVLPMVVAFSFIIFIFYRKKREAHFKQVEMKLLLDISELEIKALRAQINPHFIFNCLNSIHHFMHSNDINKASDYLIKFSYLIRHVLETSSFRMIPLADELNALQHYIQLEQLRMDHSFEFEIITDPSINPNTIEVPPMLIQPFVENSIWHGLNSRGKGGQIRITIARQNDMLKCSIEDNGITDPGLDKYSVSPSIRKTSMGMALIKERLDVVNKFYHVKAGFEIVDLENAPQHKTGKRVDLLLPFDE